MGANMRLKKHWTPIIDRFQKKLSTWKSQTLTFGGRLKFVKSVIGNLPNYYMSLFVAPSGFLDKLERIRRCFLWGGSEGKKSIHWVSWDKVIAGKNKGGLEIASLKSLNISLLVKWWWRLRSEPTMLWVKVITGIHKLTKGTITTPWRRWQVCGIT